MDPVIRYTTQREANRYLALCDLTTFLHQQKVQRGMSLRQMSMLTGVDHAAICRYLKNESVPALPNALALVDGLIIR